VADAAVRHPDHSFSMRTAGGESLIHGDPLRIRQMVDNVLANAGRHTPAGTEVSISVGTDTLTPEAAVGPGKGAGDGSGNTPGHGPGHGSGDGNRARRMVRLEVADNGPGVETEAGIDLFERFVRADKSRTRDTGGSGLGLSIVRGVAQAHGGSADLVARGPDNPGTTVVILLPAVEPS
jgi:signal transduction histidine kinase